MTSTAKSPNTQAPNSSPATTAPSYASAAGASQKPAASTPSPAATGSSNPPAPVVVGGSSAQHAKSPGPTSVNGRSAVTPAVPAAPAASHGSNNMNGASVGDHSRKSSVTISATGPNSYAANGGASASGSKSGIQFGFKDSPGVAHSTPQMSAAPIPIPGGTQNQRVPSPAHSPSPIPQPSASGGRPPSGMAQQNTQMTFGSLGSDGDRHMRQGSVPQNPAALSSQPGSHIRRESAVSQHSDVSAGPGGPGSGANRPNFQPQAGRGRGGPPFNPQHPPYTGNAGFPPNYRPNSGRGGMPPAFHPGRPMAYPNSPQPTRSPALAHSQPGTPNMPQAQMHHMPMQTPPQYHYGAPNMGPQQVPHPSFSNDFSSCKPSKIKVGRQDPEKFPGRQQRRSEPYSFRDQPFSHSNKLRRPSRRGNMHCEDPRWLGDHAQHAHGMPPDWPQRPFPEAHRLQAPPSNPFLPPPQPLIRPPIDLSPESGNFERMLTTHKQFGGYPPAGAQFDHMGRQAPPPYGYMPQPYMGQGPGGPPAANYQQGFVPPTYHNPAPTSMSRTSSHSDRPPSSTGQPSQPVVVSGGTPQTQHAQPKSGALPSSFRPAKKSAAITIKNAQGETLDFSGMKTPASPSPSTQPSKTPPVAASTPPPQKPGTPSAHNRVESQSAPKSAKEIQEELRAKIMKVAPSGHDEKTKDAEPIKEQTPADVKASESEPVESKTGSEEAKKPEVEDKDMETDQKPAEPSPAAAADDEEDEIERQIREMEEEEARREKAEAEYVAKKKAEDEEKKKQAEANKPSAEEEDRKLREAEREAERLEEEKEKKRAAAEAAASGAASKNESGQATEDDAERVGDVTEKLSDLNIGDKSTETASGKPTSADKQRATKPPALNLAPINTKSVEPPQPSAALQSLKSARFLTVMDPNIYPAGISSPNPAVNAAVAKKGKSFKYDAQFLLQFQKVFTEQPSMEFHQQVKSLIGDSDRSASTPRPGASRNPSRSASSFAPAPQSNMGSFSSARGTTSAERFARSNAALQNGMPPPGGMGSFGRTGSFPMGAPMSRNPSTTNMGAPNSPRTNSRRGNSRRDNVSAKEAQAAKTMPLTAGQEVKPIAVTASGWKPTSLGKQAAAGASGGHMDPEMVQRKVKAALNKMTPEKFERIADQILDIAAQSKNESDGRTLRQVIQLTFEKATDEAHWASMYAKFCKRMLDTMSTEIRDETLKDKNGQVVSGGALFRKYLLNRCQEEFERGWKVNLPEAPAEEKTDKPSGEAAMLSDEYYAAAAAKRRGLGLVQFIGELYKLGMLTERIMHACVQKLVDYESTPDEAEIESLSKLLRTIGANLDASPKGKAVMDAYFDRIQNIINMPDLQSRLQFMLMDVVDLRKAGWNTKDTNKGPKTLDEIRAEAEAAAALKAQENARGNQRGGPGGRAAMGRGDARSFSNYGQQASNQVGMDDLRRLKGATSRAPSGNVSLGPTSMFSSRSNSGRRLGPGGSLGRPGEDSGASSRTGTPPTTHTNAFSALANLESETPASPPSTAASPALSKAVPDRSAAGDSK